MYLQWDISQVLSIKLRVEFIDYWQWKFTKICNFLPLKFASDKLNQNCRADGLTPNPPGGEPNEDGIVGGPRTPQQIAAQKRLQQTQAQVDEVKLQRIFSFCKRFFVYESNIVFRWWTL